MRGILCSLFVAAALCAQTPAPAVSFEVATIKPAPDLMTLVQQMQAGKSPRVGVKIEGHRVEIGFSRVRDLIAYAYDVPAPQVSGPEAQLDGQRWEINATMPEGATKEQAPQMVQALLADRFGMKTHREKKEHQIYALIVAKGGLKMKEAPADDPAAAGPAPGDAPAAAPAIKQDGKGGATINGGPMGNIKVAMSPEGLMHLEMSKMPMAMMIQQLTPMLDHPVVDMTELKGNYQVAIDIPMSAMLNVARAQGINVPGMPPGAGAGPADAASDPAAVDSIFKSMEKLGLKLDLRKQTFDDIVIDHVEKTPTEN